LVASRKDGFKGGWLIARSDRERPPSLRSVTTKGDNILAQLHSCHSSGFYEGNLLKRDCHSSYITPRRVTTPNGVKKDCHSSDVSEAEQAACQAPQNDVTAPVFEVSASVNGSSPLLSLEEKEKLEGWRLDDPEWVAAVLAEDAQKRKVRRSNWEKFYNGEPLPMAVQRELERRVEVSAWLERELGVA